MGGKGSHMARGWEEDVGGLTGLADGAWLGGGEWVMLEPR